MHFESQSFVPPVQSVSKNYQIMGKLGQGSYASVYRAKHKKKHTNYAIKQVTVHPLAIEQQLKEIESLTSLLNDHIIKLHDFFYDKDENELNFVMELANGSLRSEIATKDYSNRQLVSFLVQMVSAFLQLTNKKLMHLDLKPENILLAAGDSYYKICDFGCSQTAQRSQLSRYNSQSFGTFNYLSPQNYLPYEGKRTNFSADIWSLGIILYEMIFKKMPFKLQNNGTIKIADMEKYFDGDQSIINYSKPPSRKQDITAFVKVLKLMLKPIPSKRISWVGLRQLLIQDFGVGQAQFLDVCVVYPKHLTLMSIFLTILLLIRKNQSYNPHEFWTQNTNLLNKLTNTLLHLAYLYGLKFNSYFGYKCKSQLILQERQNMEFMTRNIEFEQQILYKKTGQKIPSLEQTQKLQNYFKQQVKICKQNLSKHRNNFWEAMKNLDIFCEETMAVAKKGTFFLCGDKENYGKTIQVLQIVI